MDEDVLDKIKEIRTRLDSITEGEWIAHNIPYDAENSDDDPYIETEEGIYIAQTVYDQQSSTQKHNINADTVFIANAKNDIEFLLNLIQDYI